MQGAGGRGGHTPAYIHKTISNNLQNNFIDGSDVTHKSSSVTDIISAFCDKCTDRQQQDTYLYRWWYINTINTTNGKQKHKLTTIIPRHGRHLSVTSFKSYVINSNDSFIHLIVDLRVGLTLIERSSNYLLQLSLWAFLWPILRACCVLIQLL